MQLFNTYKNKNQIIKDKLSEQKEYGTETEICCTSQSENTPTKHNDHKKTNTTITASDFTPTKKEDSVIGRRKTKTRTWNQKIYHPKKQENNSYMNNT